MNKHARKFTALFLFTVMALASLSSVASINAQAPQVAPNAIELVGTITAVGTNSITVNGIMIDISKAQLSAGLVPAVNQVVKVEGTLQPDGSIIAREVKASKKAIQPGELEITGMVDSLNATTIVINGQSIDISKAEIGKGVAVGKNVRAHVVINPDGTMSAREVSVAPVVVPPGATPAATGVATTEPGQDKKEFELVGTLDQMGGDSIVVSGKTISTVGAEIKGTLVVGALVKVHIVQNSDGSLVAREVELAHGVDNDVKDDKKPSATPGATKVGGKDDKGGKGSDGGNGQKPDDHGQDGTNHDKGDDKGGNGGNGGGGNGGSGGGGSDDKSGHK